MSAAARKRIGAAMKKRWAERKKAAQEREEELTLKRSWLKRQFRF